MTSEVRLLRQAIEGGDWNETSSLVSRMAPRLVGDQSSAMMMMMSQQQQQQQQESSDPSRNGSHQNQNHHQQDSSATSNNNGHNHNNNRTNRQNQRGDPSSWNISQNWRQGRTGYERDMFVSSGGLELFLRIFREPIFIRPRSAGLVQFLPVQYQRQYDVHLNPIIDDNDKYFYATATATANHESPVKQDSNDHDDDANSHLQRQRQRQQQHQEEQLLQQQRRQRRQQHKEHQQLLRNQLGAVYYDARQLNEDYVSNKLAHCWNETLTILRELVFYMPEILQELLGSYHVAEYAKKTYCGDSKSSCTSLPKKQRRRRRTKNTSTNSGDGVNDKTDVDASENDSSAKAAVRGQSVRSHPRRKNNTQQQYYLDFVPWLFTLLSHDSCFDSASALIEEILSLQSQAVATASATASASAAAAMANSSQHGSAGAASGGDTRPGDGSENDAAFATSGLVDSSEAQSQAQPQATGTTSTNSSNSNHQQQAAMMALALNSSVLASCWSGPLFYLGDVPNLYGLWGQFTCRQTAHVCRILALLVFEPEDRHLMESPTVLRSTDLLRLRRERAARPLVTQPSRSASYVDENQSMALGDHDEYTMYDRDDDDEEDESNHSNSNSTMLIRRLIQLLQVMNYAPDLHRSGSYHVMAHFPWVADTLLMLGLNELEDFGDLSHLDTTARRPLRLHQAQWQRQNQQQQQHQQSFASAPVATIPIPITQNAVRLSTLGSVATMFETLSGTVRGGGGGGGDGSNQNNGGADHGGGILLNQNDNNNNNNNMINPNNPSQAAHLGHIINVLNAAQAAGVVVGSGNHSSGSVGTAVPLGSGSSAGASATAMLLSGHNPMWNMNVGSSGRSAPATPTDEENDNAAASLEAANELQFNAMLLAPYQVEVLFVLCTLLGGRRKLDAQRLATQHGLVEVLNDMFYRLSWGINTPHSQSSQHDLSSNDHGGGSGNGAGDNNSSGNPNNISMDTYAAGNDNNDSSNGNNGDGGNGIHGPGCECNPESALRVQYLRLLHNFCDRDCDNYRGRRLLLSTEERHYIFERDDECDGDGDGDGIADSPSSSSAAKKAERPPHKGLLSKVTDAYIREPEDSPYKFWLASCIESYLRGSSPREQIFVAESGLLIHLIKDILSDRVHCAGSLQTSFDLLGEICKGNLPNVTTMLRGLSSYQDDALSDGDSGHEESNKSSFQRLMTVGATNLVDSNVFLRSLLLTVERFAQKNDQQEGNNTNSTSNSNSYHLTRGYLTHSWWDQSMSMDATNGGQDHYAQNATSQPAPSERMHDQAAVSDWFLPLTLSPTTDTSTIQTAAKTYATATARPDRGGLYLSVGDAGWIFSPDAFAAPPQSMMVTAYHHQAQSLSSSSSFPHYSDQNVAKLYWFLVTNQSRLLRDLLHVVDLQNINHENICCLNTAVVLAVFAHRRSQLSQVLEDLRRMNPDDDASMPASSSASASATTGSTSTGASSSNIVQNLRELLWFWTEYYSHRGRDRLSLEFSSHIRFQEWMTVVHKLCADIDKLTYQNKTQPPSASHSCSNNNSNSNNSSRNAQGRPLPASPYSRPPRSLDGRWRSE
jgi:hypothetical protein